MEEPREDAQGPAPVRWSRAALALAILLASLPLAGKLILGAWGFAEAAEAAFACVIVSAYLRARERKSFSALPDEAAVLEQAIELAASGRRDESSALLTEAIHRSPRLWQALQYRGQLRLSAPGSAAAALEDFTAALSLAPGEPHLHILRGHALQLLGDEPGARAEYEAGKALAAEGEIGPSAVSE